MVKGRVGSLQRTALKVGHGWSMSFESRLPWGRAAGRGTGMGSSRCRVWLAAFLPLALAACEHEPKTLDQVVLETRRYACERAMKHYTRLVEEFPADSDVAHSGGGRTATFLNVAPERRRAMEAATPLLAASQPATDYSDRLSDITYAVDAGCRTLSNVEYPAADRR